MRQITPADLSIAGRRQYYRDLGGTFGVEQPDQDAWRRLALVRRRASPARR